MSASRRFVLAGGLASLAASALPASAFARLRSQDEGTRFSHASVIDEARALSARPFTPPEPLPEGLSGLDYDTYRAIRFRSEAAVWAGTASKFSVQMFAPGSLYADPVDILLVESGRARPVQVSADAFEVPRAEIGRLLAELGRLAGFRLHYPINNTGYVDEFAVFQGASYFRAVSRGQTYGLSARGLAIDTGEPGGEEFPVFRRFWIERPSPDMDAIVVHALLDSRRVTGAYRFGIYPGSPTAMEVSATLFPRARLSHVGLGCLTSMYMHGPLDPPDQPDFRPRVHDSMGLAMHTGTGERLWRPLSNPRTLQLSGFRDRDPKGFGLSQRVRAFDEYQDLEARYDTRPSAWVSPQGGWGEGHVQLVEIPSGHEGNDNIVAYWRPAGGLAAGQEFSFAYTLRWPDDVEAGDLGRVARSALGRTLDQGRPQMAIDWTNPGRVPAEDVRLDASVSAGAIVSQSVAANPVTGGYRGYLTFDPQGANLVEMRVRPIASGVPAGETWLYRWTQRG